MAETKLEWALEALRLPSDKRLCECEDPSVEGFIGQVAYLKCMKCGKAHSAPLTLGQVRTYQIDSICT